MASQLSKLHRISLDWFTPHSERTVAKHARVSAKNPDKPDYIGLIKYCLSHKHFSIFEQVCASYSIVTTRCISAEIIRHRSFSFQELSQRYCNPFETMEEVGDPAYFELRKQDKTNRQNSIPLDSEELEAKYRPRIVAAWEAVQKLYEDMCEDGLSRETSRNILPIGSPTRLHMQGTLRSWLFYVGLRSAPGSQKEHMWISHQIGRDLRRQLPDTIEAVIELAHSWEHSGLEGWRYIDECLA